MLPSSALFTVDSLPLQVMPRVKTLSTQVNLWLHQRILDEAEKIGKTNTTAYRRWKKVVLHLKKLGGVHKTSHDNLAIILNRAAKKLTKNMSRSLS